MAISALPNVRLQPAPQQLSRGNEPVRPGASDGDTSSGGRHPAGTISPEGETPRPIPAPHGLLNLQMDQIDALQGIPGDDKTPAEDKKPEDKKAEEAKSDAPGALTEEEQDVVRELANMDREVRAHEQAHAAAGGAHAGAPSYQYQQGPDGKRYAVGGEVSIDTSPVQGDPKATIAKMRQVKAAASAPAQPSGQDRAVASAADAISRQAQAQLQAEAAAEIGIGPEKASESAREPGQNASPEAAPDAPSGRPPRDIPPGSITDFSV